MIAEEEEEKEVSRKTTSAVDSKLIVEFQNILL
jgi:hypothetical protein